MDKYFQDYTPEDLKGWTDQELIGCVMGGMAYGDDVRNEIYRRVGFSEEQIEKAQGDTNLVYDVMTKLIPEDDPYWYETDPMREDDDEEDW